MDTRTQLVGLIGWPVAHSVSPAMHNAAFAALGLNWCYVPLPVAKGQVAAAVRGLAALGFRGANVTVPHKQAVLASIDWLTDQARQVGAANTLLVRRDAGGAASIGGDNTDAQGFVAALRSGGWEPAAGRRAVILGAGGAARAVAYGLLEAGIGQIAILNRSRERADALVADLNAQRRGQAGLRALELSGETLVESARAADLFVNATPAGMWPAVDDSPWPSGVPVPAHLAVFDLVYNPPETRLLCQAQESGAHPMPGLDMLVQQAALAFRLWTGEEPPLDVMRAAAREALVR